MNRDSSNTSSQPPGFLQIPPPAAFMSVGLVLPEYWVLLVLIAAAAMTVVAFVQKVRRLR